MSFEDAGDLASFAAIAESATANREGKIKRVKTATDLIIDCRASQLLPRSVIEMANISSSYFALIIHNNNPLFSWRSCTVWEDVLQENYTKSVVVIRYPVLPLGSKSFPGLQKIEELWRSPQTSFSTINIFPQSFSILQTSRVFLSGNERHSVMDELPWLFTDTVVLYFIIDAVVEGPSSTVFVLHDAL